MGTPPGTVAVNLRRIIDVAGESPNAWSRRHGLTQGSVSRILRGAQSPTEDMIAALAAAAGLHAWQLLVPGLDPRNPPVLREIGNGERELYERLEADLRAIKARILP